MTLTWWIWTVFWPVRPIFALLAQPLLYSSNLGPSFKSHPGRIVLLLCQGQRAALLWEYRMWISNKRKHIRQRERKVQRAFVVNLIFRRNILEGWYNHKWSLPHFLIRWWSQPHRQPCKVLNQTCHRQVISFPIPNERWKGYRNRTPTRTALSPLQGVIVPNREIADISRDWSRFFD